MSPIVLTAEFTRALRLLEEGKNLFLTGKAGTGKSTLIRHFMGRTERNVVVVAPTGIAALNVAGYTIHRLFSFHPTTTLEDVQHGRYYPGRFASTLKELDTLIIDEASMVRADLFDQLVAALERFGPRPGRPFGGVQIVLVGDLLQLPPVVTEREGQHFATRYETPYFFSAHRYRREDFPTVALTTVFRQLGDDRLTSILNAVREGVLLGQAQDELNSRTDSAFEPPDGEFWLTLAPTNRVVAARNRQQLDRLEAVEHRHTAVVRGDLDGFELPTDHELVYKVGAQVMLLTNDPADRWANGTLGRIVAVGGTRAEPWVRLVLRDGATVEVTPHRWEVTRPVVDDGRLRHEVVGSFTQLPVKLAWAITIHKSQGQTLDRLVVDLSGGTFAFGQLYVALSRCTTLDGLVLKRPLLPKDLKTDRRILRFLRETAPGERARGHCALAVLTVGDEGRMSRPRPVELAVAFDDGTAISTLVNPGRDLADARSAYGITTADVLVAPTLAEAWSLIAPAIAGCVPVGVDIDRTLELIDFELKRLGRVVPLPLGSAVGLEGVEGADRGELSAGRALARARAALVLHSHAGSIDPSAGTFDDALDSAGLGYLLTRDPDAAPPALDHLPELSAILDVSRQIAGIVLGHDTPVAPDSWSPAARRAVAQQLGAAAARVKVPRDLADRLDAAGAVLGQSLMEGNAVGAGIRMEDVLVPGARVCFTGTVVTRDGRTLSRDAMNRLAESGGLSPVESVTKTRCEALIVAEEGTQSGKARKAQEYGKPVFSAEEFLAWLDRSLAPSS